MSKQWPRPKSRKVRGLGDAVALVAQPIARGIDAIAGSNLKNCPSCPKRQAWLNGKVPFTSDQ